MDATDDVSYRVAQIMYWPSRNSDGKFETIYNSGRLVDPDEVFEAFGPGWQDWTQLPYSEKRGQKRPTTGKKAEIPTDKRGIVGAFCRATLKAALKGPSAADVAMTADFSSNLIRDLGVEPGTRLDVALPPDRLRVFAA